MLSNKLLMTAAAITVFANLAIVTDGHRISDIGRWTDGRTEGRTDGIDAAVDDTPQKSISNGIAI